MKFLGEIAALATAFFFALTALIFTSTGRSVGSQVTNRMRLLFALFYLIVLNLILFRQPLPFSAGSSRWLWLSLSGIIGLSLGDAFLFQSLVSVGTRLGRNCLGRCLSSRATRYSARAYPARRVLWNFGRFRPGGRTCSFEAGNVWRSLAVSGECDSHARGGQF